MSTSTSNANIDPILARSLLEGRLRYLGIQCMLKDQAIDDRHSRLASNERNIVAFRASIENHRRYWEKLNADEEKGDWTRIVMDRLEFQIKWDESWLAQCADSEVRLRGEISGLKEEKRIMEREGEGIRKQIAEMKAA